MDPERSLTAVVFSGGLGLSAYHGGAFEALTDLAPRIDWVAGSSAGAITAALIAGSGHAIHRRNGGDVPVRQDGFLHRIALRDKYKGFRPVLAVAGIVPNMPMQEQT